MHDIYYAVNIPKAAHPLSGADHTYNATLIPSTMRGPSSLGCDSHPRGTPATSHKDPLRTHKQAAFISVLGLLEEECRRVSNKSRYQPNVVLTRLLPNLHIRC